MYAYTRLKVDHHLFVEDQFEPQMGILPVPATVPVVEPSERADHISASDCRAGRHERHDRSRKGRIC
ncbi:hypothetical protein, partial [Mesorhizobium sp. P5_C1]